ncbi:ankyrin, partial [Clathrospora elynae]
QCLLESAARDQRIPLLTLQLDRKAKVDQITSGTTTLCIAIRHGQVLSARMLLRAGADVNNQFLRNQATLMWPVFYRDMAEWCIPLLLAHGASTNLKAGTGNTLLHDAVGRNRIHAVKALLESGADIETNNEDGTRPLKLALDTGDRELISTLLLSGAGVHRNIGGTPSALFYAIFQGLIGSVQLLLEDCDAERDIRETDGAGCTVLHYLALSPIRNSAVVELLVGYEIEINVKDHMGDMALHIAAFSGKIAVAKKLLEQGAKMHLQNQDDKTPLDYA